MRRVAVSPWVEIDVDDGAGERIDAALESARAYGRRRKARLAQRVQLHKQ